MQCLVHARDQMSCDKDARTFVFQTIVWETKTTALRRNEKPKSWKFCESAFVSHWMWHQKLQQLVRNRLATPEQWTSVLAHVSRIRNTVIAKLSRAEGPTPKVICIVCAHGITFWHSIPPPWCVESFPAIFYSNAPAAGGNGLCSGKAWKGWIRFSFSARHKRGQSLYSRHRSCFPLKMFVSCGLTEVHCAET